MNKYWLLTLCLLLVGLPVVACAPSAAPAAEPKIPAASNQVSSAPWEQKWADILAEGKKEGVVTVYATATAWGPETRIALTEPFKKKFGIDLDLVTSGRGAELAARVQQERSAGLNIVDVIAVGANNLIGDMKPKGLLGDIEPLLLLPEVTDPKAWGGKLPFVDKDKKALGFAVQLQRPMVYNTGLVKKGELTSYKDLLKPQYKGKLILNDPTITGSAFNLFGFMALSMWNLEETKDFLRQLIKQQDVVISRDTRLVVETVAKGKYAVALAPPPANVKEFLQAGAPIDVVMDIKEGTFGTASNGTIGVPTTPAHPNAARVFINWLLSKEGQTTFSRIQVSPSLRTDVPAEGIDPRWVPQPGEKIFWETEESSLSATGQLPGILTEVVRQAEK